MATVSSCARLKVKVSRRMSVGQLLTSYVAVPRTRSEGRPLKIWRSIRVAHRKPRPDEPPTVVVNIDSVTRPFRLNAAPNEFVAHACTFHLLLFEGLLASAAE